MKPAACGRLTSNADAESSFRTRIPRPTRGRCSHASISQASTRRMRSPSRRSWPRTCQTRRTASNHSAGLAEEAQSLSRARRRAPAPAPKATRESRRRLRSRTRSSVRWSTRRRVGRWLANNLTNHILSIIRPRYQHRCRKRRDARSSSVPAQDCQSSYMQHI